MGAPTPFRTARAAMDKQHDMLDGECLTANLTKLSPLSYTVSMSKLNSLAT